MSLQHCNNETVKVSIIIPIYNVEQYLEECILSVINQSMEEIEIICVNDASTDRSAHIIEKYHDTDKRIKIINHNKNMGTLVARKSGVINAKGEYILFLDGDDAFLNTSVCESLYNIIKSKEADIVSFNAKAFPNGNEDIERTNWINKYLFLNDIGNTEKNMLKSFLRGNIYNIWNKIYKTSICKQAYSFIKDSYCINGEDMYVLFIILFFTKKYYHIKEYFYAYRVGSGVSTKNNLTKKDFVKYINCHEYVLDKIKYFLIQNNSYSKYHGLLCDIKNIFDRHVINSWKNRTSNNDKKNILPLLIKKIDPRYIIRYGLQD